MPVPKSALLARPSSSSFPLALHHGHDFWPSSSLVSVSPGSPKRRLPEVVVRCCLAVARHDLGLGLPLRVYSAQQYSSGPAWRPWSHLISAPRTLRPHPATAARQWQQPGTRKRSSKSNARGNSSSHLASSWSPFSVPYTPDA
ncbi:hypothetical protein BS78_02G062900 [Paspalum vaginatum]|nr:hypothetical protein BS78_02G062900 [Paspalum vaginatum]